MFFSDYGNTKSYSSVDLIMEFDNNKVEVGVRMQYYFNELGHSNTLTATKDVRTQNEGGRK